jgi:hypothetical protein
MHAVVCAADASDARGRYGGPAARRDATVLLLSDPALSAQILCSAADFPLSITSHRIHLISVAMSKPSAAAAAAAPATPVDLKSSVKSIQGWLASQKPAEAIILAIPLLKDDALEIQAAKDGKQKPLAYNLCAFAGLAYAQTKAWEQAEATFLRATAFDDTQFPAWKVRNSSM